MKKITLLFTLIFASITLLAQNEVLTNQTIINLVELGFEDNVIITKISTSETAFETSIEALKALKEKGVSGDIIVAMMQASKPNVIEDNTENIKKTGIYFKEGNEYKKILPTAFSSSRTNTLGSNISNTKTKSILINEHSTNTIKTNIPQFYFRFNNVERVGSASKASNWWFSVASSPNEFILVKLVSKKGKRELKTGEIDLYSGNFAGVESKDIIKCNIETISDTEFRVVPEIPILPDEYCFFYQGTTPHNYLGNQAVFDFSVPEDYKIENKYNVGGSVWVLNGEKPKKLEVMSLYIKTDGIYYSLRERNRWKGEEYKESMCYPTKEDAINAAK